MLGYRPLIERACVHHPADVGGDQRLGRDPIEVLVVDHRDLPRRDALDQPLGPRVDASEAALRLRPPQRPPEQASASS